MSILSDGLKEMGKALLLKKILELLNESNVKVEKVKTKEKDEKGKYIYEEKESKIVENPIDINVIANHICNNLLS